MSQPRKIIHIDIDAFYASVELKDRPELRGQPMIVATDHPRAVVTTATYEARKFGLRSAMSVAKAKQLCPHVVCIAPDFNKYRAVSLQLHEIFQQYTAIIEPISLDEAFLDVTQNHQNLPSATEVAQKICADIYTQTALTASAGVAPNKFLAKIASDWNKPNGIFVVKPHQILSFIHDLPLEKIPGVGAVTLRKLHAMHCFKISDLQKIEKTILDYEFGKFGHQLFLYAQGIDDRPVQAQRERQQISKETTFSNDLYLNELKEIWEDLAQQVWKSMRTKALDARGIQIKLKTAQFKVIQHSRSFSQAFSNYEDFYSAIQLLLNDLHVDPKLKYRLIGVGVFSFTEKDLPTQLSFL